MAPCIQFSWLDLDGGYSCIHTILGSEALGEQWLAVYVGLHYYLLFHGFSLFLESWKKPSMVWTHLFPIFSPPAFCALVPQMTILPPITGPLHILFPLPGCSLQWKDYKMTPMILTSCCPYLWVLVGACDLQLTNRIWQGWWDVKWWLS